MSAMNIDTSEHNANSDLRSIHIGNVDFKVTAQELEDCFSECGEVERVTIRCDPVTKRPLGYAFLEFKEENAIVAALTLDGTLIRGRPITVRPKRKNFPGMSSRGRGRGRGRGLSYPRGRGYYRGRGARMSSFALNFRYVILTLFMIPKKEYFLNITYIYILCVLADITILLNDPRSIALRTDFVYITL